MLIKHKAKKATIYHRCYFAFLLVDFEPKLLFKEPFDTCHHPVSGTQIFHHNDEIIFKPDKMVTTSFQFLTLGGERTNLLRALKAELNKLIVHIEMDIGGGDSNNYDLFDI